MLKKIVYLNEDVIEGLFRGSAEETRNERGGQGRKIVPDCPV